MVVENGGQCGTSHEAETNKQRDPKGSLPLSLTLRLLRSFSSQGFERAVRGDGRPRELRQRARRCRSFLGLLSQALSLPLFRHDCRCVSRNSARGWLALLQESKPAFPHLLSLASKTTPSAPFFLLFSRCSPRPFHCLPGFAPRQRRIVPCAEAVETAARRHSSAERRDEVAIVALHAGEKKEKERLKETRR